MSNGLLAGKRGIIFGALDDKSIAWQVAEKCVAQGAKITLTNVHFRPSYYRTRFPTQRI